MVFSVRRLLLAALLVVAAVIWVRINGPVEGRTLLVLTEGRGVTVADLLSVVALLMALVLAWPSWRPPQQHRAPAPRPQYPQYPYPPQQQHPQQGGRAPDPTRRW